MGDEVSKYISKEKIKQAIQGILPFGIECEVHTTEILSPEKTGLDQYIAIFMIIYRGEEIAITQKSADVYRSRAEKEISRIYSLRKNKLGRTISKPIPYMTLRKLMDDYSKSP